MGEAGLLQGNGKGVYGDKAPIWFFRQGNDHDLFNQRWKAWDPYSVVTVGAQKGAAFREFPGKVP